MGNRSAAGGPDAIQPPPAQVTRAAVAARGQALEDRVVLAVDGDDRGAAFLRGTHQQLAREHQRFLVRQQQALAGARRGLADAVAARGPSGAFDVMEELAAAVPPGSNGLVAVLAAAGLFLFGEMGSKALFGIVGGAAMIVGVFHLIAALTAEGTSRVEGVNLIDRGYLMRGHRRHRWSRTGKRPRPPARARSRLDGAARGGNTRL